MFQEELVSRGIDWVTNYYPYVNPEPANISKVEKKIISHIKAGSTIGIFPDSDVDGFFSALIMKSLLELLGCKKVKIIRIRKKTHGLNSKVIDQVMMLQCNLLITVDSSTNSREEIEKLSICGVDHVIIDHHIITEDISTYPSNVFVVNSRDFGNEKFNNVSCGMLCYIIAHDFLNKVQIDKVQKNSFLNKLYVLGYITLYTDSMNLADEFNLSVINNIEMRKNFAPALITQFMSDYDDLNRNFIEYKLGPRINSLIRRERFDIVYDLLFKRNSESESAELLRLIESCYLDGKNMVDIICNNISVEDHDTYVVANLDTMQFNDNFSEVVKNYTGLIANRIASRYNKLALVLCTDAIESYKGSVRDPYSRQALRLFERFISCGGHMSAFGVRVLKKDYKSASRQLELLSHRLKTGIQESQIELDGEEFDDRLIYQLRVIADYNEVSGNTLPKAVIRKRVGNTLKVTREEKYSKVKWGDTTIIVFNNVYIGDTLIITPTISKNSITCFGVHATK